MIDSYDSFVYNLVQYLGELGADPVVVRNDQLSVEEAVALEPDAVLLSPGPGRPESSGIICHAIGAFAARGTPLFGVCLGHQAIGHVYGADVVGAPELMHGKTSPILHDGAGVFAGLPSPLTATRYHSLTLAPETIPDEFVTPFTPAHGRLAEPDDMGRVMVLLGSDLAGFVSGVNLPVDFGYCAEVAMGQRDNLQNIS